MTITKQIWSDWLEEREKNFNIQKNERKVWKGGNWLMTKKMGQTKYKLEEK